jgi:hypothetical protein
MSIKLKNGLAQPLSIRDAEIFGDAPTSETRAKREEFIPAQYVGRRADLKDAKGECYFDAPADVWKFRVKGGTEWFRVNFDSLRFMRKRVKKKKVKSAEAGE